MAAPTAANLQSYVAAVPANMINNIPAASFFSSGLSPFSLPAAQVPNSVVIKLFRINYEKMKKNSNFFQGLSNRNYSIS